MSSSENQNDLSEQQPAGEIIEPVAFQPSSDTTVVSKKKKIKPVTIIVSLIAVALAAVLWFVFSAKAVLIQVEPIPDSLIVEGGTLKFQLGGRHMLRKGSYQLKAEKEGFHPLVTDFEVGSAQNQDLQFNLKLLPGKLSILSEPTTVEVLVDGQSQGEIESLELDAGQYAITLKANGYLDYDETIEIEGRNIEQELAAQLTPAWAAVSFTSSPPGAQVVVNDQVIGQTPITSDIPAGSHLITLTRNGYKSWRSDLSVEPNVPIELPTVQLERADGTISVSSNPAGATVTVAGRYYGLTPVKLKLPPGSSYKLALTKAGFQPTSRNIDVRSNEGQSVALNLSPIIGVVRFISVPGNADVYINGQLKGKSGQKLELPAVEQEVEFRKPGYATYQVSVTPRPGFDQSVSAQLRTLDQARWDHVPKIITPVADLTLNLLRPEASFSLGASRREPGRRANEAIRPVQLTRAFYVGVHEVTNLQFRHYRGSHVSGESPSSTVNEDNRPVSALSWQAAAAFCNWLSDQESLPRAYREEGGQLVAVTPMNNGYRLPTEAEWAFIARYAGQTTVTRYPWGNSLPPPPESGNFADTSARQQVSKTLASYDDHYPSVAPVGSFPANDLGIYDLSGNVSEWVHDYYAIGAIRDVSRKTDPLGPEDGAFHVIRGSSWMHGSPVELRWAYRDYGKDPRRDLGFRVARYVE